MLQIIKLKRFKQTIELPKTHIDTQTHTHHTYIAIPAYLFFQKYVQQIVLKTTSPCAISRKNTGTFILLCDDYIIHTFKIFGSYFKLIYNKKLHLYRIKL